MLSQHFKSPSHVQRLLSRPGGSLLEGYSQYLQQRGYAKISVCTHITAASHFLYWSSGEGITPLELDLKSAEFLLLLFTVSARRS